MEFNRFLEEIIKGTNEYLEIREIDHEGNVTQHFLKPQDINKYTPPKHKNVIWGFSRNKRVVRLGAAILQGFCGLILTKE